jgi:hydroxymethylbilane synthase
VSPQPLIRIGARGSKLSLAQSRTMQLRIAAALGAAPEDAETVAPLVVITTSGDRIQDRRLLDVGGKALFTKEIEEALSDGRIDCAIHSMKDVPAELPDGLVIAAIPKREDPRDALILGAGITATGISDLPEAACLGTASLRRQAQALHLRPDLDVQMLRGNVDTRLAKLAAGEADAILLANAGLNRLGFDIPRVLLDPIAAPPAPGQGALAVETRIGDRDQPWVAALRCLDTTVAVAAERGALCALEGSCRTAMGAHAVIAGGTLTLVIEALSPDAVRRWRREGQCAANEADAWALGLALGQEVRAEGGDLLEV